MATAAKAKLKPKKAELPTLFIWQGTNKAGRKVKGEQAGESIQAVRADLRRTKYVVNPRIYLLHANPKSNRLT